MAINRNRQRDVNSHEGFLQRWSRRKLEQHDANVLKRSNVDDPSEPEKIEKPLCDDDMPPLDSLDENSDYSGFLSKNVSEKLRKQALRKLFSSQEFNIRDGLDDYDGDYTQFTKLGDIITADIKHRIETELKRKQDNDRQQEITARDDQSGQDIVTQADSNQTSPQQGAVSEEKTRPDDDVEVIS